MSISYETNKEKKTCSVCLNLLPQGSYTRYAWQQGGDDKRACRSCVEKEVGYWKCKECAQRKPEDEFAMWLSVNAKKSTNGKQYCDECAKRNDFKGRNHWRCIQCKGVFHKVQFSQWIASRKTVSNKNTARCNACKDEQDAANVRIAKSSLEHIAK